MFARPSLARHVLLSPVFDGSILVAHGTGNLLHRLVEVSLAIAGVSIEKPPVDADRIGIAPRSKLVALVITHNSRSGRETATASLLEIRVWRTLWADKKSA